LVEGFLAHGVGFKYRCNGDPKGRRDRTMPLRVVSE
jgi:hypothetical protein